MLHVLDEWLIQPGTQQWTIITIPQRDYMETQLHKYFMSWATLFCDWKARERRAIVFHDMTSADIPLTVSATAFQNQDGGSFTKLWTDFLIKIFRVGKIYANQDTPGNIIICIKFSWNRPKFPFKEFIVWHAPIISHFTPSSFNPTKKYINPCTYNMLLLQTL